MSEQGEYTRFRLNLPGFSVELSGEKTFVEEFYRKVYMDLLPLIEAGPGAAVVPRPAAKAAAASQYAAFESAETSIAPHPSRPPEPGSNEPKLEYTWIYSCTPHYNKVYVVENRVIHHSVFGRYFDPRRVRRIYLEVPTSPLFGELSAGNKTLWAEITPEGRRMIEAAAQRRKGRKRK